MNMPLSQIRTVIALLMITFMAPVVAQGEGKEIVAYFPEWGVHLQEYYVKNIVTSHSANKLTVLNYAFVIPGPGVNGDIVCQLDDPFLAYQMPYTAAMAVSFDPEVSGTADGENQPLRGHFNQLRKLKEEYSDLKILAAIGGWTGSTWFSDAASTKTSRENFVASCIDMFIYGNLPDANNAGGDGVATGIFDGFDIDWEYPITGGDSGVHHSSNDDVNLTLLLAEFRDQLNNIDPELVPPDVVGEELMLTMATPGSAFRGDNYQISQDKAYVDWFNLMTYDFHGPWEKKTGHLTNLLRSPDDPSSDAFKMSMDDTVRLYRDTYGVGVDQLVPGATFYGLGWRNVSSSNDGLYQSGQEAPGIHEGGYNYYKDLVPLLDGGYSMYWDSYALASWIYSSSDGIFWSMDEPQSLALKSRYVDAYDLRGVMFWEISGDDADGTLLSALSSGNPSPGYFESTQDSEESVPFSIDSPENCAISLEGFNVVINASTDVADPDVAQVEFFQHGESIGFDDQPPWSWAWFNLEPGIHPLTATLTETSGDQTDTDPVYLNVYEKDDGDGSGVSLWQTGVSYQVGDEVFYQGCIYSAKRNHFGSRVRTPSSGRYWSLVTCSDCGGGGGTGENPAPIVNFTSPANGDVFTEGAGSIDISVTASDDPNGSVVSVDFSPDTSVPCSLATVGDPGNYSCSWANPSVGNHQLTVVAIDNLGASAEASINIVVQGDNNCSKSAWVDTRSYKKGDEVEHDSIRWRAKKPSLGVRPGTSPSKWTNLGLCVN